MAQQAKKKSTGKKAPQYSSNTVALRYVGGLLLMALGALMFLATAMNMEGSIFDAMRALTYGLGGVLGVILPVLPVWGGILTMLSAQRKAPLRAFVMASVLYLLVLTVLTLSSQTLGSTGTMSLMDFLLEDNRQRYMNPADYDVFLARSFELGRDAHHGGGLLGMLLAWPLWRLIGVTAGFILAILLTLGDVLLLFRKEIVRLREYLRKRSEQEQADLRAREMEWRARQQIVQPVPEAAYPMQGQGMTPPQYPPQPVPQPMPQPVQPSGAYGQPTWQQQGGNVSTGFHQGGQEHYARMTPEMIRYQQAGYTAVIEEEKKKHREKKSRQPQMFARKHKQEDKEQQAQPEQPKDTQRRQDEAYRRPEPQQPVREQYEELRPAADWQLSDEQTPAPAQPTPAEQPPMQQPAPQPAQTPWQQELERKRAEAAAAMQAEETADSTADDTPPWEEPVPKAPPKSTTAQVKAPKLQQEPPKAVWQPELHLPPRKEEEAPAEKKPTEKSAYVYPPITLLKPPVPFYNAQDSAEDEERIRILEATVESFKMPATVEQVTHGPRISRFEMRPEPGILVHRYQLLAGNIAMNTKAESVRIESPIPGTEHVGVEIPNKKAKLVTLREVLESPEMKEHKSPLAVALGCDVAGKPVVCDIIDMPHLLIAGATKMGKSVCINSIINSVLYRTTPAEVRMILIDPKVVELQCYNGLPNLLLPVVNDPKKAAAALDWAVAEMMERYNKLSEHGVRKIEEYNNSLADGEEKMHYILIVIDEMADLMMVCGKEVEASIQRLAQLARAAGIHLILATQRPTVKVITGNIKANIPGRIAFKTSSVVDSQTILDGKGAEGLLGNGDMIYKGGKRDIRTQGCFISTEEIENTVKYICDHNTAEYDPDIIEQLESAKDEGMPAAAGGDGAKGGHIDPLLMQAIEWTVQERQISVTNLQRKLSLGYARAARLVDMMEERGIVSAKDGTKPRMCLISYEEYQELRRDAEESI